MANDLKMFRVAAIGATAVVMIGVRAMLRVAPGAFVRWGCTDRTARNVSLSSAGASHLTPLVDRAAWYLSATCLERALTLLVIFRVVYPSCDRPRLLIGAVPTNAGLRAHAWLEAPGGEPLGAADDRLLPLRPPSPCSLHDV